MPNKKGARLLVGYSGAARSRAPPGYIGEVVYQKRGKTGVTVLKAATMQQCQVISADVKHWTSFPAPLGKAALLCKKGKQTLAFPSIISAFKKRSLLQRSVIVIFIFLFFRFRLLGICHSFPSRGEGGFCPCPTPTPAQRDAAQPPSQAPPVAAQRGSVPAGRRRPWDQPAPGSTLRPARSPPPRPRPRSEGNAVWPSPKLLSPINDGSCQHPDWRSFKINILFGLNFSLNISTGCKVMGVAVFPIDFVTLNFCQFLLTDAILFLEFAMPFVPFFGVSCILVLKRLQSPHLS